MNPVLALLSAFQIRTGDSVWTRLRVDESYTHESRFRRALLGRGKIVKIFRSGLRVCYYIFVIKETS